MAGEGTACNTGEVNIRTTITADSVRRLFGPPGAIDYRAHPGEGKEESPVTIFSSMKESDMKPMENIALLKGTIYSMKNRRIITRWLRDVCVAFHLKNTTLCLSIQLTDAYLIASLRTLAVEKCQLAAVVCLWIAAKFEELDADLPSLRKMVTVCDNAYRRDELVTMEEDVLRHFKWRLPHTTVANFLYLQIHMLSTDKLVQKLDASPEGKGTIEVALLILGNNNEREWKPIMLDASKPLRDSLPQLSMAAGVQMASLMEVFQLFGVSFLLAQRTSLDTVVKDMHRDANGTVRLYLSSGKEQSGAISVDSGSYVILRSVNNDFLELCECLIQEVVVHVQFLTFNSFVVALSVIGLAFCMLGYDTTESRTAVHHIATQLNICEDKAVSGASFLYTKYLEAIHSTPISLTCLKPQDDVRANLATCFGASPTIAAP